MDQKSSKRLTFLVDEANQSSRLDKALTVHSEIQSRTRAAQLIEEGYVWLVANSSGEITPKKMTKVSYKVEAGELFRIDLPDLSRATSELQPLNLKLDVVYEDEDLIVLNKPTGLVVHPAAGHAQDTLVNALIAHTKDLSMGFQEQRPGIVHRIDRDTSGLLVVAKNDRAHQALSQQFQEKSIHRVYWSIVYGCPTPRKGTVRSYLKRHPTQRKMFCSSKDQSGKHAITHFHVMQTYPANKAQPEFALVHCQLETGRTHQIRVHLSEMGNAIVGDPIYSTPRRLKGIASLEIREMASQMRLCLHAAELGFVHPVSARQLLFKTEWPSDIKKFATRLGFVASESK